ncbi:LCP family protein [Nocardioides sambongensis]|uniref:LCP family protein n=1 Tax=Nocardioides sambongensis TaxID=2589074 RepID=UPI00112ABC03|nr:LCP family protein [Nocardioides sambongensis]
MLSHDARHDLTALLGMMVCAAVAAGGLATGLAWAHSRVPEVHRTEPAFAGLTDRPPRAEGTAGEAMNILLVGTDRRSDVATTGTDALAESWLPGEQRADTLMVVHVSADRRTVQVVSIPRDSWVQVPGHGRAKVNASYSWGGLPLTVETIEDLTGTRIDHVALVDWTGFAALVDQAGGIDVTVPATVRDRARDRVWRAGEHHLDGEDALDYVGQRYGLPEGDLDRVRRQQAVVRTMVRSLLHTEMRSNPAMLGEVVQDLLQHVSVDETWSLREIASFALSLRDLRSADITFLTAPVTGFGYVRGQSVVHLDRDLGRDMWRELRRDRGQQWLAAQQQRATPEVVR